MRIRFLISILSLVVLAWAITYFPGGQEANVTREGFHERRMTITSSSALYHIQVGGFLDMDNTMTRSYNGIAIGFQNNESLILENTGSTDIRNPRIITNGERRWWNMEVLLKEALEGAATCRDSILFLYGFETRNRYHDYPIFVDDSLHDPVAMFNAFGGGFCDDAAFVLNSLLTCAGLGRDRFGNDPRARLLRGHMVTEAVSDQGFLLLDPDQDAFYLGLDNVELVSGDDMARDHYLVRREVTCGPELPGREDASLPAAMYGTDDGTMVHSVQGRAIDFILRPGEKIEFRWDRRGLHPLGPDALIRTRKFWGTSLWTYEVPLPPMEKGPMVVPMSFPYPVCGARVIVEGDSTASRSLQEIGLSLVDSTWTSIPSGENSTASARVFVLDPSLAPRSSPPRYGFRIRVADPGALTSLRIETDLMVWPLSLPRLRVGQNSVQYQDDTEGPRRINVVHRWRESHDHIPPAAPKGSFFPGNGATVSRSIIPFSWGPTPGADLYHVQVSTRPDMRLPFRPAFDVYVDTTTYRHPFTGMFNPGVDYYWRVKARNASGTWGPWTGIRTFRWNGPMVPVALDAEIDGGMITLHWKANPNGNRPVRFEVYGSDEKGFIPSMTPYDLPGLGPQPENLLGTTPDTSLVIVNPADDRPGLNKTHYRVVAVDANGTRSGPSSQFSLPHPRFISSPPPAAAVGEEWRYRLRTLESHGDFQFRYVSPHYSYWEREGYAFELDEGPDWMHLDGDERLLYGIPGPADTGSVTVKVTCRRLYPHEVDPDDRNAQFFLKDQERYQASDARTFDVQVH